MIVITATTRRLILALFFLALLVAVLISSAHARWKPQYANQPAEIQAWFKQQRNAQGQVCCDRSDGHPFFGQYDMNDDGSVTLHLAGGKTHTLPAYMVLHGPNPTGHAVWWYLSNDFGHRDYCFAPGTLS